MKSITNQSNIFLIYIKIPTEYYKKNNEKLRKEARERYQNLPEKGKNKKR